MSSDGGSAWSSIDQFYEDGGALAADPGDSLALWSGGTRSGRMMVSRTTDRGESWERFDLSRGYVRALAIDPSNTEIVYAGGDHGLYRTTDRGGSWTGASPGLSGVVRSIAVHPDDGMIVYAGTDSGVFKTTDSGASWESTGLPEANVLAFDLSDPGIVYAGTDSGVCRSTDRGETWMPMSQGLDSLYVTTLDMVPGSGLYAGTRGSSMYVWAFPQHVEERPYRPAGRLPGAGTSDGVYDITGRRLGPPGRSLVGLPPGCYVVRENGNSRKVVRVR